VRVVGPGAASQQLLFAKMAEATQAAALGMVEHPVPSQKLLPAAEVAMASALKLPDYGRCLTKAQLNEGFANEWEAQVLPVFKTGSS
jgi:enoyl-CoA hydratase/carnithine racemase